MGCNAWGHPSDCKCGWGGDTGGGRGTRSGGVRRLQVVDGHTWCLNRRPTYDAFLNPNAECPVCGEPVYFYRSPFGGRVFFDDLGPPWPKHPCTDNSASIIVGPVRSTVVWPGKFTPHDWRPLAPEAIQPGNNYDLLVLPTTDRFPADRLVAPSGWIGDAPSFWRWSVQNPVTVEISCVRVDANNNVDSRIFVVPSWIKDTEEIASWIEDGTIEPSPAQLNAIGYALSFAWKIEGFDSWYLVVDAVDMSRARALFERSAAGGYWEALNNLAVIYERGLGVHVDKERAFHLYSEAALSRERVPLAHLVRCFRAGIGCTKNLEEADRLEALLATVSTN
jgi:hypothetical protein